MPENQDVAIWTDEGPAPRFGALARRLRSSRRLSQAALAQAAGISPSTVRGWEAGRSEPSMPELGRWSRALGISDEIASAVRATLSAPRAWAERPGIGLGPYLRERRLAQGATLSRAAAELGLPLATLGHYESGRVEVPAEVLAGIVGRFQVVSDERTALCGGTALFLEWCDSLVAKPEMAQAAAERAAFASTPDELLDRGPAFVRLRTGLLRARLRGAAWGTCDAFATSHHAHWLAVGERRTEAAAALVALESPRLRAWNGQFAVATIAQRYLGRARAEELLTAAPTTDPAHAAWLRAEAALDLCERRRGPEARVMAEQAVVQAEAIGRWVEAWARRRDGVRVALRLRDWDAAEAGLAKMAELEPSGADDAWRPHQRRVLEARIGANEASARSAGP